MEPALPSNIDSFYETLISVAGVLLGIGFAAILFILQSGFSSFKYTRVMLIELYLYYGKQILLILIYLTLIPLMALYLPNEYKLISVLHFIFCVFLLISTFKYIGMEDEINITFSESYNKENKFLFSFFIGFLRSLYRCFIPLFIVIYPYILSYDIGSKFYFFYLSEVSIFYSVLMMLLYAFFRMYYFVVNYFEYTKLEFKNSREIIAKDGNTETFSYKNNMDLDILKRKLIKKWWRELDGVNKSEFNCGELTAELLNKGMSVAHFNFRIHVDNCEPRLIKEHVAIYSYNLSKELVSARSDINEYKLNFIINGFGGEPRNIYFAFNSVEFETVKKKTVTIICVYMILKTNMLIDYLNNLHNKRFKRDFQRVAFLLCVVSCGYGVMRKLGSSVVSPLSGR
ncbi:TPA: hypothetical protein AB5A59_003395 [Vibrio cholerae]|uniref:hypothetical protein n=1 Tax=Vibrio TaxID=662 RepID=UPI00050BE1DF|nr:MULTISPECIES: hypothetical protein [Vibrio]